MDRPTRLKAPTIAILIGSTKMALEDILTETTNGSQEIAMSDPKYAEMVALSLLSQGRIPTAQGFVRGDTPNAVVQIPQWMRNTDMWGRAPTSPTTATPTSFSQPSQGSFSVMGGPSGQVRTLGDLENVAKLIKGLPAQYQTLILSKLTGLNPAENDIAKQLEVARYKHQLEAPERAEKRSLARSEAISRQQNRTHQQQLGDQMMEMRREAQSGTRVQFMNMMRSIIDSENVPQEQKQLALDIMTRGMQQIFLEDQQGGPGPGQETIPQHWWDQVVPMEGSTVAPPATRASAARPTSGKLKNGVTWKVKSGN